MGLVGYDLNQYPLEQHYRNCRKYILESGFGASDDKDRIYLSRFEFCKNVNEYLFRTVIKTKRPIETKHITEGNRYSEKRKCCVFTESRVLVARKKYSVLEKSPGS